MNDNFDSQLSSGVSSSMELRRVQNNSSVGILKTTKATATTRNKSNM